MSIPSASGETLVARYDTLGDPASVLRLVSEPLRAPGPGEALVALECAVIHPSDFGMIAGTYGRARPAPAVAGREGVGRIEKIGPGQSLKIGDRVRMPPDAGVWRERGVFPVSELKKMPDDLSPDRAAQCFVNPPAAIRMLEDFVSLNPGDIVVQNAGNSAVGRAVAFLGERRRVRVVSLVRDVEKHRAELFALGADAVIADDDDAPKHIREIKGASRVRLALNGVGGPSVSRLIKGCDAGATVVTFGGMTGEPVRFPTRELIFSDVVLRGFWLDRWLREAAPADVEKLHDDVFALWRAGFPAGVEKVWPFPEILDAVRHAASPGRSGKILIRGPAWE